MKLDETVFEVFVTVSELKKYTVSIPAVAKARVELEGNTHLHVLICKPGMIVNS